MYCLKQGRDHAKKIYEIILSGQYNNVSLQEIQKFIDDVTPRNQYGRRLSERLPQRVEQTLFRKDAKMPPMHFTHEFLRAQSQRMNELVRQEEERLRRKRKNS